MPGTTVNGLLISAGTTVTVVNNLIGNLTASAATGSNAINGINLTSTQTNSTIKVYYNTVYVSNPTSGAGFGSSGIFHTVSTTATTAALDLRNNIIVNTSVQNGAGLTVAYRRSGGAAGNLANYASTSNNNDFYAGTPSATNLIYSDGTSSAQTITAYKNGVFTAGTIAPRDSASFSENPTFLSTTGSSADFLHIDPAVSTRIESGAAPIAGFTDDFDGDTRNASTPDVGADEYAGAAPDLTPPVISYTALGNTNSLGARTLTATITDASGVPTSGTGLPVLYWKINAGSYTAATATSLGSNQYQFSFGAGAGLSNTVSYYVVAQDSAATPNVSANPSTGAGGFTFNPPAASTPPTTPNSYTITGNFNVGAGQAYTTLTAAVAALNGAPITGPVVFNLTDANYTGETFPITINANSGSSAVNTVTIKPASGVTPTISGSSTTSFINLNGCKFVIIDGSNTVGGTSRDLTIENTSTATTASTVHFILDASNNTVANCIIKGASTALNRGTVFFDTGSSTGNLGNTISNNTITNSGANFPANGIYSAGTSGAIFNSGTISGNNIQDYFSATLATAGINLSATGNSAWTITNNKLFQTATRVYTTANIHSGILVGTGSGYTINGNTVGFANASGTGTTNMVGNSVALTGTFPSSYTVTGTPNATTYNAISAAFTAGGAVSNTQGNTIGGFALYTSSNAATANGVWCGINVTSGNANIGTTTGNTIGATTGNGSIYTACTTAGGTAVGIFATSANTVSIQNNTIGAVDAVGTTASLSGGFTGIDTAGTAVFTINSNIIGNATANNIRTGYTLSGGNLSNAGTLTSTTGATAIVGLRDTASGATQSINSNTIRAWATSGTGALTAISSSGPTTTISYNEIYDLSGSNAGSTVNGLLISAGTPVTVFNNLIGNLTASAATGSNAINGINLTSTQTNSTIKVYYNTVYVSNPTSGAGFGSSGIFHTVSSTATTAALDLRNNIIVNTSVQNGAGLTVAYRRSGGASGNLANYAGTSNNNDFYAGTPSASNVIYSDGTSTAQTITAYKNGAFPAANPIAPRDSASFSENPTFLSTSGASADFLHIDPTVSTRIESGAAPIGGFTDDFDGDTRNATTPDVGADEYAGAAPDLTPPVISYTALGNTNSLAARTLTATITDASGVPTSGTGLPVLYWKINAGSYTAATASSQGSNQYLFSFGAGAGLSSTVSYYVVAQDSAATPNVSANPSTGAGGFTFNPPAASTPPTTPNSYTITGNFNVGVGQAYTTLTAAVAALNGAPITGPIVFNLTDASYTGETFPITINANSGSSAVNTVTIKPASGVTPTISGSSTTSFINLNGCKFVIIDGSNTVGGTSRDLTIENTSTATTASTVHFILDASNNTVANCTIKGASTALNRGTVFFDTGSSTGNLGNTISNNTITNSGANFPANGIYSAGTSGAIFNSGTISGNNIQDYFSATLATAGINLSATGNSAWTITNNKLFQTATRVYTTANIHSGILVGTGSGYTINGNTVGFANASGTGTTNMVGNSVALTGTFPSSYTVTGTPNATTYNAISAAFTAGGAVSNTQGNTIGGFALYTSSNAATANGVWCGINVTSGNANIGTTTGNTIGATTGNGSIYTACTTAGGTAVGIFATSANTVSIQNNTIGAVDAVGTTASLSGGFTGIDTAGTAVFTISSNTIGNATANNIRTGYTLSGGNLSNAGTLTSTTGATAIVGLRDTASGATQSINSNTIRAWATSGTGALTAISSSGPTTTISYNEIYDLSGSNAGSTVNGLLISAGTPVTVFNNLIGNLTASAATGSNAINGINLTSTQTNSTIKVYYNTVYVSNPTSGAGFGSSGIFHTVSSTATTAALDLRNNIIVNTSVQNGAGLTVAYRRSGGASGNLANYASTSNNNDFYAGTPSASNVIYSDGTSTAQTITQYKNGAFPAANPIAPRDSASFSENPTFLSTSGASADFLHIDPTVSTRIESGAAPIGGFTDDFDGDTRNATTPDVGADEYAGAAPDLTPPVISYTALGNTNSLAARTLTATITDASGVPTSGTGLPVLYWKINAGSYTAATASSQGSNQYLFSFGAGAGLSSTVSYYVVAQDSAATPNVSANPSTGAGGFTFNPPAASTPPTTPNSYTITGNFNVGVGQTYTTLTAAVAALNGSPITGPIVFNLTDASYAGETFPITINANSGSSAVNTVTIKPASGVTPTISGSNATAIINLNGCDFVIIDGSNTVGGTSRDLTIENTSTATTASTVHFILDASNNTVANCTIKGANAA